MACECEIRPKEIVTIITIIIILGSASFATYVVYQNMKYNEAEDEEIIVERVLYEQFAYSISNSHSYPLILDVKVDENCPNYYNEFLLNLKASKFLDVSGDDRAKFTKIYKKKLCYENYKLLTDKYNPDEFTYGELLKNGKKNDSNECDDDYIPCGILDTYGNLLCFPKKYGKCPLNDIKYSDEEEPTLKEQGYVEQSLGDGGYLYFYYGNSTTNEIIVENFFSPIKPFTNEWDFLVFSLYPKVDGNDEINYESINNLQGKIIDAIIDFDYKNATKYKEIMTNLNDVLLNISKDEEDLAKQNEEIQKCYVKRKNINYPQRGIIKNLTDKKYQMLPKFQVKLSDIQKWNIDDSQQGNIPNDLYVNWYTKNYIGFKDYENYKEYLNKFGDLSYIENPMYEMSNKIIPANITLYLLWSGILFIVVLLITHFCQNPKCCCVKDCVLIVLNIFMIVYCLGFLIDFVITYFKNARKKYTKINIIMDEYLQETLDLYQKRRNSFMFYIIACLIFILGLIFSIISLIVSIRTGKDEKKEVEEKKEEKM